ncbi:MAG: hypothetical protein QOE35_3547 [Actinomycetota bacterium]
MFLHGGDDPVLLPTAGQRDGELLDARHAEARSAYSVGLLRHCHAKSGTLQRVVHVARIDCWMQPYPDAVGLHNGRTDMLGHDAASGQILAERCHDQIAGHDLVGAK